MNKFVLIAIILASISGVGVLSHNMFPISLQSLQVFSSIDEFTDPICSCQGEDGTFSPENCGAFAGDYQDPNGLCTGIAATTEYGEPPKVLAVQGCGVGFWKNNVAANPSIASIESEGSVWPPGYQPDYYYADMFQTTLVKPQSVIAENEQAVEEINEQDEENEQAVEEINEQDEENEGSTNDVVVQDESHDQQANDSEEVTGDENNETKDGEKVNEETTEESEENEIHTNDVVVQDESKEDATGLQIIPPADKEKEDRAKGEDKDKSKEKEDRAKGNEKEKLDVVKSAKGPTLLEALELKGGKENALIRQSVAAMLNAAHSDINYPYTVPEIIALTQIALSTENYEKLVVLFEENNENLEKPPLCLEN